MAEGIKVIIADDVKETRENIKALLAFEKRIIVLGEAENGEEAVSLARNADADIILMDINMPVKDGIKATEEITAEVPNTTIIIMSVQSEHEYLRKAMLAGAREFISKPFTGDELVNTILQTYAQDSKRKQKNLQPKGKEEVHSRVITVFSTKGGVGKTTLATNLAVSIARQTRKRVALIDMDLLFGNVAVHLNVSVRSTIADLVKEINALDEEMMEEYLVTHFSGVKVLPAPSRPEYAEYITASHIEKIIRVLRQRYHYIIIDTGQNFNEQVLSALDASETILFVSTMDLPAIRNVKIGLDIMETLKYPESKIKVVLNRASEQFGIKYAEFENAVKAKIWGMVPEDSHTVINSVNKGFPFVLTRVESRIASCIYEMGAKLTQSQEPAGQKKSFIHRMFAL